MTFQEWFYSAPHRAKYTNDHSAYLAAQEAWEAAHKACAALADAQRSNTNVLLSYPTQSSAAYNIGIAIRARGKV